jgi:hypothetical protein
LTTDEELKKLEESMRRLKVEYESYFSGGLPRAPRDSAFRLESTFKRMSEGVAELTLRQRFRFNQLQQKYMVYGGLWRKRTRDLEEGRSRKAASAAAPPPQNLFAITTESPETEGNKVNQLFDAFVEAKRQMGESPPAIDRVVFAKFVRDKAGDLRHKLGCKRVEFCVKVEDGRIKLMAGRG